MSKRFVLHVLFGVLACLGGAGSAAADSTSLLCPALPAAEATLPADPAAEPVFLTQGPCTVTRGCFVPNTCPSYLCPDVDIQCSSGAGGYCSSGPGGSCGGWVECDGVRTYCTSQSCPPPCGGAPTCTKHSQCTSYCSPDPPFCSNGCCICI